IAFNSPIERLKPARGGGWDAALGGSELQWLSFDAVVNCAGLGAQRLARATEGYPPERVPRLVLAKGNYFGFAGRPVFSRLIYPVPVPGGLGVHVTLDLAGRMRFGPDVEWIEREDYDVDAGRAAAFYQRIRDYWPGLPDNSLMADYCGIRPKLTGPGEAAADFLVEGPGQHGLARIVHLFRVGARRRTDWRPSAPSSASSRRASLAPFRSPRRSPPISPTERAFSGISSHSRGSILAVPQRHGPLKNSRRIQGGNDANHPPR